MKRASISLTIVLALALAACQLAQIVQLVNAAVLIAEQAAAITGVIPPQYVAYVQVASTCLAFISTEQTTADTAVVRYDKDAAACAKALSPALPAGTAQDVTAKAAQLAAAIQDILTNLKPPPPTARVEPAKPLSDNDVKALRMLSDRAKAAGAAVGKR